MRHSLTASVHWSQPKASCAPIGRLLKPARRVAQGVAPKFQRLSADVQLANLQSSLVDTENQAAASLDDFKFLLGIPVETHVRAPWIA